MHCESTPPPSPHLLVLDVPAVFKKDTKHNTMLLTGPFNALDSLKIYIFIYMNIYNIYIYICMCISFFSSWVKDEPLLALKLSFQLDPPNHVLSKQYLDLPSASPNSTKRTVIFLGQTNIHLLRPMSLFPP
uniref:Uncharacterized protein n=1 Tax=Sphaerodactylus townsendi TaxID=933632 RepID=A0ACB8EYQ6_9SAUR